MSPTDLNVSLSPPAPPRGSKSSRALKIALVRSFLLDNVLQMSLLLKKSWVVWVRLQ